MALNAFEGGVVLVSHDERLLSLIADELWVVMPGPQKDRPGTVQVFDGTFEEYRDMLRDEMLKNKLIAGKRLRAPN
jgi:ATPase subunit of ABC transporter with duplicated ATPase domains